MKNTTTDNVGQFPHLKSKKQLSFRCIIVGRCMVSPILATLSHASNIFITQTSKALLLTKPNADHLLNFVPGWWWHGTFLYCARKLPFTNPFLLFIVLIVLAICCYTTMIGIRRKKAFHFSCCKSFTVYNQRDWWLNSAALFLGYAAGCVQLIPLIPTQNTHCYAHFIVSPTNKASESKRRLYKSNSLIRLIYLHSHQYVTFTITTNEI